VQYDVYIWMLCASQIKRRNHENVFLIYIEKFNMKKYSYLIILFLLFSCKKESVKTSALQIDTISNTKYYQTEIFSTSNLKLYGQWHFLYIFDDAGIIQGPGKINPTYDYLVIKKYGIYGLIKDNKLIQTGEIEIIKQDNSQFEIKLKPDNLDSITNSSWYYVGYTNDSILMRDANIGCGVLYNVYKRQN
jgi:hypothetical protein